MCLTQTKHRLKKMKTIFLASGKSSRMDPLSDKTLFLFCGKPLLIHLLENAQKGGLDNFIVVTNTENKSSIEQALKKYNINAKTTIQPNLEDGMAGGIIAGLKLIKDTEEVIILGGNDYVIPQAYKDVLKEGKKNDGALLGQTVDTYFPGGYINIDPKNIIKSIIEKPGEGNEPSNLVNIVVHYFKKAENIKKALQEIKNKKDDWYEQALEKLFQSKTIKAVEYKNTWQAIKYPWHILDMQKIILEEELREKTFNVKDLYNEQGSQVFIHETVQIADTARIRGTNILIEEGVKIHDNAVIQGPCYIGKNCIVGNNALVRDTHLGKNSVAGYNTEIARSYIGSKVTTHISYIGDSIVENNVNFGAFSTTANLRFDKKDIQVKIKDQRINSKKEKLGAIVGNYTQIGIHACLMPGCKIPQNSFINSGEVFK